MVFKGAGRGVGCGTGVGCGAVGCSDGSGRAGGGGCRSAAAGRPGRGVALRTASRIAAATTSAASAPTCPTLARALSARVPVASEKVVSPSPGVCTG